MRTTEIKPAEPAPAANGHARRTAFDLHATDVTGTYSVEARNVERSSPAGAVAQALASRMALPQNVPWTLRNDRTGAYLDESLPIGDQVDEGAKVVLTPRAHLG